LTVRRPLDPDGKKAASSEEFSGYREANRRKEAADRFQVDPGSEAGGAAR
jgi:hypothetical protein